MGLLPWAQEVPSSNLGAPTTYFLIFNELFLTLLRWRLNLGPNTSLSTLSAARRCSSGIACKQISRVISGAERPDRVSRIHDVHARSRSKNRMKAATRPSWVYA